MLKVTKTMPPRSASAEICHGDLLVAFVFTGRITIIPHACHNRNTPISQLGLGETNNMAPAETIQPPLIIKQSNLEF